MPRQEWGDLKPYEVVQKVHPVIKKQGADVVGWSWAKGGASLREMTVVRDAPIAKIFIFAF